MHSTFNSRICKLLAPLMLASLTACAAVSPPSAPPPVIVPPVRLTPLPPSVSQIDSRSSEPWLTKAQSWLQKLGELSDDETPKSQPSKL